MIELLTKMGRPEQKSWGWVGVVITSVKFGYLRMSVTAEEHSLSNCNLPSNKKNDDDACSISNTRPFRRPGIFSIRFVFT